MGARNACVVVGLRLARGRRAAAGADGAAAGTGFGGAGVRAAGRGVRAAAGRGRCGDGAGRLVGARLDDRDAAPVTGGRAPARGRVDGRVPGPGRSGGAAAVRPGGPGEAARLRVTDDQRPQAAVRRNRSADGPHRS
ncbi:hypothetical protein AMK22_13160 [Streptomyces sp. CB01580]|nr:hypothetical protein AMK22_13160 [Streptomyces sp. CB01580]